MLFQWISVVISKVIDSIYRFIQEENMQWDDVVHRLDEEVLLSIERYDQMRKRFDEAKFFMHSIVYKKLIDIQKKDFIHAGTMCSIRQSHHEKSTQTMKNPKMIISDESQLIDDLIIKLEQLHLNLNHTDGTTSINETFSFNKSNKFYVNDYI